MAGGRPAAPLDGMLPPEGVLAAFLSKKSSNLAHCPAAIPSGDTLSGTRAARPRKVHAGLSQTVGRFVRKIFNEHKRETNSSI